MILTLGTTPAVARSMIFETVRLDAVNRTGQVRVHAAGKAINVARVLRLIGHEVICTGLAGGGPGQVIRDDLDRAGIAHSFVYATSPTRVCVTVIDRSTGHATELVEEAGPATASEAQAVSDVVRRLAGQCEVLVCSGSLAGGLAPESYRTWIDVARSVNPKMSVVVDAAGAALRHTLASGVVVRCNVEELLSAFSENATANRSGDINALNLEAAMTAAVAEGALAVIVSDGPRATRVLVKDKLTLIETPAAGVVSAIGSGDAMAGGVAAGIRRRMTLLDSARLGVACAVANVQTAVAGLINPDEVERLFLKISKS